MRVDNVNVGNDAIIDWGSSTAPAQHSFNCIAILDLGIGYHTIQLVGTASGSSKYYVGAKTDLSVLVTPSPYTAVSSLSSDGSVIDHTTAGLGSFDVGTLGVQQVASGAGDSSRTVSASYLATGANALATGNHTVIVYVKSDLTSTFKHVGASKDLPLIYFD